MRWRVLVVCACLAMESLAMAQDGFSAQRLHPSADATSGFVANQRGSAMGADAVNASIAYNHAFNPFVLESTDGLSPGYDAPNGELITSQVALHLLGAVGPTDWIELGIDVPILLHQSGEPLAGLRDPNAVDEGAGLGAIRLIPRVMVLDTRDPETDYPIMASVGIDAALPTGSPDRYQGGQAELQPMLSLELDTPHDVRLVGNLGYSFRPQDRGVLGVDARSDLAWGAGVSVKTIDQLRLVTEVVDNLSTEALFSALVQVASFSFAATAGVGLDNAPFTPDARLFVRVGYVAQPAKSLVWRDKDGDTIPDWQDECPTEKEDLDGFSDTDGCPDTVRDYIESMPQ